MSDAAPVIEVRGLSKSFGGVHALREVPLAVWAGEVHALLGENGAGKIHPDQDHHRRSPARRRRAPARRPAGALRRHPRRAGRRASPPSTRSPASSPTSTWPRTSSSAGSPLHGGRHRLAHHVRRGRGAAAPAGRAPQPAHQGPRAERCAAADGRDRPRALDQRPRPDHGRADLLADAAARWPSSSRSCASCAPKARPSSSSRTAWRSCSQMADRVTVLRDGAYVDTRPWTASPPTI